MDKKLREEASMEEENEREGGVGIEGDAVIIYLPMLMELPIAMLACARIGAVHSVSLKNLKLFSLPPFLV